jgi:hypothetical protein
MHRLAVPLLASLFGGWAAVGLAQPAQYGPPSDEARARILALDPERVSDRQVRELLTLAPAPRVLLFKGSLGADMESFGAFLQRMGYPDQRLRNPATGGYGYSFQWNGCACAECDAMADVVRRLARSEGAAPVLVGHSGGGVTVSRILQVLASADGTVPRLPYAATLGTGALLRRVPGFPGCTADIPHLGLVPASVQAFTGYRIAGDPFTSILGFGDYRAVGGGEVKARVRNVLLSPQVSHVNAFEFDGYADHPGVRAWIDAYQPDAPATLPESTGLDLSNLPHAADLWHSLKKQWALQARQWASRIGRAD